MDNAKNNKRGFLGNILLCKGRLNFLWSWDQIKLYILLVSVKNIFDLKCIFIILNVESLKRIIVHSFICIDLGHWITDIFRNVE